MTEERPDETAAGTQPAAFEDRSDKTAAGPQPAVTEERPDETAADTQPVNPPELLSAVVDNQVSSVLLMRNFNRVFFTTVCS